jgi:hypothetical protein
MKISFFISVSNKYSNEQQKFDKKTITNITEIIHTQRKFYMDRFHEIATIRLYFALLFLRFGCK